MVVPVAFLLDGMSLLAYAVFTAEGKRMINNQHKAWLQQMLHDYKVGLAAAKEAALKYESLIGSTNSMLQALDAVEGVQIQAPLFKEAADTHSTLKSQDLSTRSRSLSTPTRRPEFYNVSLSEAIKQLLIRDQDKTWHLDDIANAIFLIRNEEELQAVKRTLSSELSRGVKQGAWQKVERGRFRATALSPLPVNPLIEVEQEEENEAK